LKLDVTRAINGSQNLDPERHTAARYVVLLDISSLPFPISDPHSFRVIFYRDKTIGNSPKAIVHAQCEWADVRLQFEEALAHAVRQSHVRFRVAVHAQNNGAAMYLRLSTKMCRISIMGCLVCDEVWKTPVPYLAHVPSAASVACHTEFASANDVR